MSHRPAAVDLRADDPIQKFQGRWIGVDGWEWPFHARYVAWGIWIIVFPLVVLGDLLITGSVSPLPFLDLIISIAITSMLANLTSGEVSLSQAMIYLGRMTRIAVARILRRMSAPRPVVTYDRVRVHLSRSPDGTTALAGGTRTKRKQAKKQAKESAKAEKAAAAAVAKAEKTAKRQSGKPAKPPKPGKPKRGGNGQSAPDTQLTEPALAGAAPSGAVPTRYNAGSYPSDLLRPMQPTPAGTTTWEQ